MFSKPYKVFGILHCLLFLISSASIINSSLKEYVLTTSIKILSNKTFTVDYRIK